MSTIPKNPIGLAATNFGKQHHNGTTIFAVSGTKTKDGKDAIGVTGTEEGLASIPDVSEDGYPVIKRTGDRPQATETTIIGGAAFIESVHNLDYEQVKPMHEQFSLQLSRLGLRNWMSVFTKQDRKWRFEVTVKNEADLGRVYDNWMGIDVIKIADKTLGLQKD